MNKKILTAILVPMLLIGLGFMGSQAGCITTSEGEQGFESIEQMSDAEFAKWKLYITLGVKVGANRLLQEGIVGVDQIEKAATVLDLAINSPVTAGVTSFISEALEKAGLTTDEVSLLLIIVEQELFARGGLEYLDENGVLSLAPRTKDLLNDVVAALKSVIPAE